jgi:hypothetical protein
LNSQTVRLDGLNGGYTLELAIPGALEVSTFPHLGYSGGSLLRSAYGCAWPPRNDSTKRANRFLRALTS